MSHEYDEVAMSRNAAEILLALDEDNDFFADNIRCPACGKLFHPDHTMMRETGVCSLRCLFNGRDK